MIRSISIGCAVLGIVVAGTQGFALSQEGDAPVSVPLTVTHNPGFGTYKAQISIALGEGRPLPFGFDTGSVGLRVFADARLEATPGVRCSTTPTSVTYGNPGRITYDGVVCYAPLHFANVTEAAMVPIAYLTSASCPNTNPSCKIPDLKSPRAMHGYGVFGAGLAGTTHGDATVPNPITLLPGRRGSRYSVVLRRDGGELELGPDVPPGAVTFARNEGTTPGQRYSLPRGCLYVNGRPTGTCMLVSFDTGNGVPWIHCAQSDAIPQQSGFVLPGTRLGFAPAGDLREAASIVAGNAFDDRIRIVSVPGKAPLLNASIQAFFDRVVTYDIVRDTIAVSPARQP